MREALLFVFIAFAICAGLYGAGEASVARVDLAAATALHITGGVIAGAIAFGLAIAGLTGVPARRQTRLVLPLLGGLALAGWHWSAALGLALVGSAIVIGERFGTRAASDDSDSDAG